MQEHVWIPFLNPPPPKKKKKKKSYRFNIEPIDNIFYQFFNLYSPGANLGFCNIAKYELIDHIWVDQGFLEFWILFPHLMIIRLLYKVKIKICFN